MRTVRARVTVVATGIVLLVLAATGVALVAAQSAVLTDNVDEVLVRQGKTIVDQFDGLTPGATIPGMGDDESFAIVLDESRKVVASTSGAPTDLTFIPSDGQRPQFQTAWVREADYRVMIQPRGDLEIILGTPLDDVNESVATLTRALLVAVPAASIVLALLVWLLVGRVLRPVERIRQQVAAIGGDSLHQRVPVPHSRDEVARLAATMNAMLDRIESSSERQRRFVADASHELRGPLTRIRTELEVDLAHPESADLVATHRSILDDTEGLEGLVEDLLTLARSDGDRTPGHREPIDLDDVVMTEVRRLGPPTRAVVDVSDVSGAQILGDQGQWARVVRNLLDNALRYGASSVKVALREESGEAVLRVCDDGPGIPAELHERVFERFARVDEARSATRGTGLGLAIAREIVLAHRGTITIDRGYTPGACFEVRVPLELS